MKRFGNIGAAIFALLLAVSIPAFHTDHTRAASMGAGTGISLCAAGDILHDLGSGVYSIEPRPGFSALTASPSELSCYGLQQVPGQSAQDWLSERTNYHYTLPRIRATSDSASASIARQGARVRQHPRYDTGQNMKSQNFGGYELASQDNSIDHFQSAEMAFTVPTIDDCHYNNASTRGRTFVWAGIGGDSKQTQFNTLSDYQNANLLFQAGVDILPCAQYNDLPTPHQWTGPTAFSLFFENYGCGTQQSGTPYADCLNGGDLVDVTEGVS